MHGIAGRSRAYIWPCMISSLRDKDNMKRTSVLFRVLSFILVVMMLPTCVSAAAATTAQPRASYYIDSYQAYVYTAGSGKVQVWFDVTGVTYMDELGALSIRLYESTDKTTWTRVKTFLHEDYSSMLSQDDISHMSSVTFQGVAGRYYKAYVCIWAGKDGGGDTRYLWTSAKKAT